MKYSIDLEWGFISIYALYVCMYMNLSVYTHTPYICMYIHIYMYVCIFISLVYVTLFLHTHKHTKVDLVWDQVFGNKMPCLLSCSGEARPGSRNINTRILDSERGSQGTGKNALPCPAVWSGRDLCRKALLTRTMNLGLQNELRVERD